MKLPTQWPQAILSLLKVLIRSRKPSPGLPQPPDAPLVVMGNGPSLRSLLDDHRSWLAGKHLLAVNFAANAPEYRELRPQLYVLADGHFFAGVHSDPNVKRLWQQLAATDWPMRLWIPVGQKPPVSLPANVTLLRYNLTPVEGASAITHPVFRAGLGMPRPRNVLIPAIMTAIREGYRTIYLAGADHSWSQSLWVDDENHVVSVQPHFYKDNSKELQRVRQEYAGYHLHDILQSLTIAFRSYFQIKAYADRRGVAIINVTPGSFIDAFPRSPLP